MVSVAQLAEHQIVALRAVGSSPTTHPTKEEHERKSYFRCFYAFVRNANYIKDSI